MKRLIAFLAVLVLALAACGGGSSDDGGSDGTSAPGAAPVGDASAGEEIVKSTCSACHGPDARGLENLGPDLHDNEFIQSKTDEEMVEYLTVGRPTDDPLNTTGVAMPPKGGDPSLTEDDLYDVVAYLDTLQ